MIKLAISDPKTGNVLKVNGEGEIGVAVHTHPPRNEQNIGFPFSDFFRDSAGSENMVVSTPTEFAINASSEDDIFIGSMHILLADAGAALNEFGNLSALTTGCNISWVSQDFGTKNILSGIKENLDFYRLSKQTPTVTDLSGAGADAISCFVDFKELFLLPFGIRLRKGTLDKLVFKVNDDLTGVSTFNIKANGMEF